MGEPRVVVEVWDPTNATKVQAITVPSDDVEWHQVRSARFGWERGKAFDCHVVVDADHPHVDAFTKGRVVRTFVDGEPCAPWRIVNQRHQRVSKEGHAGRVVRVSGRTLIDDFAGAVIGPARGVDVRPNSPDRFYGFATPGHPLTGWGTAHSQDSVWAGDPYERPERWTSPYAEWIWSRSAATNQPGGRCYFRTPETGDLAFTLAEDTNIVIFYSADDSARLFFDSMFLGETQDSTVDDWPWLRNWMETFHEPIRATAGVHVIAFDALNRGWEEAGLEVEGSRAGVIFEVWSVESNGGLGELLYWSTAGIPACDYPAEAPGLTVGHIIGSAITEAQGRSELHSAWATSFTDTHDSNGTPWPVVPELVMRAGIDTLETLVARLSPWADCIADHEGLVLHATVKGTEPEDSGVSWGEGEIDDLSEDDGDLPVNSLWVTWDGGMSVFEDAASIAEFGMKRAAGISLGAASEAAAASVATQQLATRAWPVQSVTFTAPKVDGKRAWENFGPMQSVELLGEQHVVAGVTSTFGRTSGGDGDTIDAVQLSTLQEERRYRRQALVSVIEAGWDVGGASAPPLDRGVKLPSGAVGRRQIDSFGWHDSLEAMVEEVDPDVDPDEIDVWQPFPISDPVRLWLWEINVSGEQEAWGATKVILMTSDGIAGAPDAMFVLELGQHETSARQRIWGPGFLERPKWVMPGVLLDGGHTNGTITIHAAEPA